MYKSKYFEEIKANRANQIVSAGIAIAIFFLIVFVIFTALTWTARAIEKSEGRSSSYGSEELSRPLFEGDPGAVKSKWTYEKIVSMREEYLSQSMKEAQTEVPRTDGVVVTDPDRDSMLVTRCEKILYDAKFIFTGVEHIRETADTPLTYPNSKVELFRVTGLQGEFNSEPFERAFVKCEINPSGESYDHYYGMYADSVEAEN